MRSSSPLEELVVDTIDGRRLGVCLWGAPDGAPLFWLHGTPGSRLLRHPEPTYVSRQLLVCTYDRPGYGISTRRPGRTVAAVAEDVEEIAAAVGWDRFAVGGVSGGGGPALAVAALVPARVTRCATVVASAPFGAEGLDFFSGMADEDRASWENAARGDEAALRAEWDGFAGWVADGMPDLSLPADVMEMLAAAFAESGRQGPAGFLDDSAAMVQDWGCAIEDVRAPTRVMVARDDTGVPVSHGEWLVDRLRDAELIRVDGGHFGPRAEPEAELLTWLGHGDAAST
jgi:pimeloyl-ACP methyl ester carboxylesterase